MRFVIIKMHLLGWLLFYTFFISSPCFSLEYQLNNELTVADLTDNLGNIYLFRYISQKYIPGFQGVVSRNTGLVSYTINPLIFLNGATFGYERTNPQILISVHKSLNFLSYVNKNQKGLGENQLKSDTKMGELDQIAYEIEVPVGMENVVAVIPFQNFVDSIKYIKSIDSKIDLLSILGKFLPRKQCQFHYEFIKTN